MKLRNKDSKNEKFVLYLNGIKHWLHEVSPPYSRIFTLFLNAQSSEYYSSSNNVSYGPAVNSTGIYNVDTILRVIKERRTESIFLHFIVEDIETGEKLNFEEFYEQYKE